MQSEWKSCRKGHVEMDLFKETRWNRHWVKNIERKSQRNMTQVSHVHCHHMLVCMTWSSFHTLLCIKMPFYLSCFLFFQWVLPNSTLVTLGPFYLSARPPFASTAGSSEVGTSLNFRHLRLKIDPLQLENIKEADTRVFLYLHCLPLCLSLENTSLSLRRTSSLSWRLLVRVVQN